MRCMTRREVLQATVAPDAESASGAGVKPAPAKPEPTRSPPADRLN
jgi:hypothetical protein